MPSDAAVGKQKTINKVKAYLSTFITDTQLDKACDLASNDTYYGANGTVILNDLKDTVMNSLTLTQMTIGLGVISKLTADFGSLQKALDALQPLLDTIANNINPFYDQVKKKITSMKAQGKGVSAIYPQAYKMFNTFVTQQRIKTIMTRCSVSVPASNWTAVRKDTADIIYFSKYGF
ncbi:hypothetical protein DdX_07209 [Ditylenchus destructor]|uniref:Uncharacterized protein n=1 Tax=Ditylenchus destructor TaxID=166010 RepID=A0AAD4R1L7_9BILA|nr:hypothetical protein DdX_07209 [Ditylenchus destructor]